MVIKNNILVTGSGGQLGKSIKKRSNIFPKYSFYFESHQNLDISDFGKVYNFVKKNKIQTIINCAAYTDVAGAEKNKIFANKVNNYSLDNLCKICIKKNIKLIHISTDYVFDGLKRSPYNEDDIPNPINFYGVSKLRGERLILKYNLNKSLIIRTSWLYSNEKNNFVSKIVKKINKSEEIFVKDNEIGSPTNCDDLALDILKIIPKINNDKTEILHYSNSGFCSRYDFASEIIRVLKKSNDLLKPVNFIDSEVKRPKYSVLDTSKIERIYSLTMVGWKESLKSHLTKKYTKQIEF